MEQLLKNNRGGILLIAGDINSSLGSSGDHNGDSRGLNSTVQPSCVGPFGNSKSNKTGKRCKSFTSVRGLIALPTYYNKRGIIHGAIHAQRMDIKLTTSCVTSRTSKELGIVVLNLNL